LPFGGGEGRDQMVELGSGRLVPGFEEQLTGASAGEDKTVTIEFPDDYGAPDLAGKQAEFAGHGQGDQGQGAARARRGLRRRAGFDTLDELREDIRERLAEAQEREIEGEFREAALDAAVGAADRRGARAADRGARQGDVGRDGPHAVAPGHLARGLPAVRGQDRGRADGREPGARRARPAPRGRAGRLSSRPRASRRATTTSWSRSSAPRGRGRLPKKLLERLRSSGRLDALKADIAQRKAIEHIADSAKPVKIEQSTTERAAASGIWTPGS